MSDPGIIASPGKVPPEYDSVSQDRANQTLYENCLRLEKLVRELQARIEALEAGS